MQRAWDPPYRTLMENDHEIIKPKQATMAVQAVRISAFI